MVTRLAPWALATILLAGCVQTAAPAAETPTAAITPSDPAAAELEADSSSLGFVSVEGNVLVSGLLTNTSPHSVQGIRLSLTETEMGPGSERPYVTSTLLPWLAPGESTPFRFALDGIAIPSIHSLDVVAFEILEPDPLLTSLEIEPVRGQLQGELLLGWLELTSGDQAQLEGLAFSALSGEQLLASSEVLAPRQLAAGVPAPFQVHFAAAVDPGTLRAFYAARQAPSNPTLGLELAQVPRLVTDAQGNPFLVGEVVNRGQVNQAPRLLISVEADGELVRVYEVSSHLAMAPGERLPFGVRLRPTPFDGHPEPVEITSILEVEPSAATANLVLLLDIQSIELTGSSVFLRIQLSNPSSELAYSPTTFAALRDLAGGLVSAAWFELPHTLPGGANDSLVMEVPLPAEAELSELEWDLSARGSTTPPAHSLP